MDIVQFVPSADEFQDIQDKRLFMKNRPLKDNEFYAVFCKQFWERNNVGSSYLPKNKALMSTSSGRVYITKDFDKKLVGSHTQWNCIVSVNCLDKVRYIGREIKHLA